MQPKIKASFSKLEQSRNAFLEQLQHFSVAQLNFKPHPDAWCALEVTEHLVKVEIGLSKLFLNDAKLEPVTLRSQITGWLLIAALQTSFRVKTPSRAANPSEIPTLENLQQRWTAHHQSLQVQLETLSDAALSRAATNHPIVKPFTLAQTLAFFTVHTKHHLHQLERIRHSLEFPRK
jgi:hypothetical protein